jgi:hypothetical protein
VSRWFGLLIERIAHWNSFNKQFEGREKLITGAFNIALSADITLFLMK